MKKRSQYRRIWTAAARSLNTNSQHSNSDNRASTLVPNLQEYSDAEAQERAYEPSLKRPWCSSHCPSDQGEGIDVDQGCISDISVGCSFDDDEVDLHVSTCSESEDELPNVSLRDGLAKWANEHLVKHNALDSLLAILKQNGHSDLPGSARALLGTRRNVSVQMKSGMEYDYLSLPDELLQHFKKLPSSITDKTKSLEISLNVDGLPLFKSKVRTKPYGLCYVQLQMLNP